MELLAHECLKLDVFQILFGPGSVRVMSLAKHRGDTSALRNFARTRDGRATREALARSEASLNFRGEKKRGESDFLEFHGFGYGMVFQWDSFRMNKVSVLRFYIPTEVYIAPSSQPQETDFIQRQRCDGAGVNLLQLVLVVFFIFAFT